MGLVRPPPEEEVEAELAFHLEMRTRELVARGVDPEEARRLARERMGDLDTVRRRCRTLARDREARMRWTRWWGELRSDVVFALRQLGRRPGFAAAAVLTLGLGIGANTAVFSVVEGVLLRPLPYEEPEELVGVWTRYLPSSGMDIPRFPLSPPEVLDYRAETRALEAVGAYTASRVTLTGDGGEPRRLTAARMDRHVLPLLGVQPRLGRLFTPEEHGPGAAPSLLLSHALWTGRFGADPGVVGRTITVDGAAARVVGVMPEGFAFPSERTRLWMPLGLDEADPGPRGAHWLVAVGRLAEGVELSGARAELEGITAGWEAEWDHHAAGHFVYLVPFRDDLVGAARPTLLLLLAAVGIVLLAACVNVATLFVARSEGRTGEMAVRRALGAGRGRLARQLLAEGGVVAALGGVLGVVVALWATPALLAIDPSALPRAGSVAVRAPVLVFTGGLVTLATLLFGLVPAWRLRRTGAGAPDPDGAGRRVAGPGGMRLRRVMVATEVALSVVVVVGAGLVVRSLQTLRAVETGVEARGVLAFDLSLPEGRYGDPAGVVDAYRRILDGVAALPGVTAASAVNTLPLTGPGVRGDFRPEGTAEPRPGVPDFNAHIRVVHPGYFEAMGISLRAGRVLDAGDDPGAVPSVVVNEALRSTWWPGEEVVGRRITFDVQGEDPVWLTVVGVVGDTRSRVEEEPEPAVYLPHAQLAAAGLGTGRSMTVVLRAGAGVAGVAEAARSVVAEVDPALPVEVRRMEEVARGAVARSRLAASLLGGFAVVALLLAAVGVYGVVGFAVARRTREIGVRMALGAGRGRVLGLVLTEGLVPAAAGVAIGLAVAWLLGGLVERVLYGVRPTDPLTFVAVPAVLLGVALVASWLPARRATAIPPAEALRDG